MQIAAVAAEALRAEIVGYTLGGDNLQPLIQLRLIGNQVSETNKEPVGTVSAALQLALMARLLKTTQLIVPERAEIRIGAPRQLQAEPLTGYCLTVLKACVADVAQGNTSGPG